MPATCSADLNEMTLRQLLDAFVDARLEKREADMRSLREEIQQRQARGEHA